ncbi:MAG: beta-lysine N6-acetyltransferase [Euryarchaeota archaeon]|nr:beta-lysine N6-acetyltransferase [Euryarchaeota archaeon]
MRNAPLTLKTTEELTGYWKKVEMKMPGSRAEIIIDYYNKRIKVMEYSGLFEEISEALEAFAKVEEMGKIIVYTPEEKKHEPETCGYLEEGIIRGYYSGKNCIIFSNYPQSSRGTSFHKEMEDQIIDGCLKERKKTGTVLQKQDEIQHGKTRLSEEYVIRPAIQADTPAMASLYRQSFKFYPTPLHMESYLLKTMNSNVLYFLVEKKGIVVSLASAEMDSENGTAEITDCLTIPHEREKGLIKELITTLEKELAERDFISAYTLCRASSSSINKAFVSLGYAYTGRLVNNCRIGGGFEDMNIWCKIMGEG